MCTHTTYIYRICIWAAKTKQHNPLHSYLYHRFPPNARFVLVARRPDATFGATIGVIAFKSLAKASIRPPSTNIKIDNYFSIISAIHLRHPSSIKARWTIVFLIKRRGAHVVAYFVVLVTPLLLQLWLKISTWLQSYYHMVPTIWFSNQRCSIRLRVPLTRNTFSHRLV